MKIIQAKYLGIYHNPFQFQQKHSLIFQNMKSKNYVLALQIQLEDETHEDIETYFMENYDVLVSNVYDENIYEFESDELSILTKIVDDIKK